MRLSNGFVTDKEKTFGELKFTAVRDVFLQNEDGTPSTQLKKRIYDLKCSLHGGIITVSGPPEVPLREFPYNEVVELVNPVADTVSRKNYTGADVDWYVKAEDIVLKNKGNQNAGSPQNQQLIKKDNGIFTLSFDCLIWKARIRVVISTLSFIFGVYLDICCMEISKQFTVIL